MTEFNTKHLINSPRMDAQSIDPVIGTTDNVLTEIIDLDTRRMNDTTFTISNTGGNSLYYSIEQ